MKKIPLTKGLYALVDDEDFEHLNKWKWTAMILPSGRKCAYRKHGKKNIYIHRQITNAKPNQVVDHVDHDCLNNQRYNLRVCDHRQNAGNMVLIGRNTSGLKGVRFRANKWEAFMTQNRKQVYLGRFSSRSEASEAYDKAANQYFGEFSLTNEALGLS